MGEHRQHPEGGALGKPSITPPLFVVGMPRSGTKLLRDLLNRHPMIGIPEAETEFLPDWSRRWPSFGDLSQHDAWAAFVEHTCGSAFFVYLREERGIAIDPAAWRLACPNFSLAGVFEGLCRLCGGGPAEGIWGDKSPSYLRHLDLVWSVWPDARVIHIVRDPRDQVQSAYKAWRKDRVRGASRWAEGIAGALSACRNRPDQVHVLRYEDLVESPEQSLKKVCAFLGLEFDAAMCQLTRPSEQLGDAAGCTQILAENVEKWRRTLSPLLQDRIQALCAEGLREFGYPCTHSGKPATLSRAERRLRQMADGFNLIRFEVAARGVFGAIRFRWRLFRESGAWE